ncbi:hypothetical protein QYE76_059266 [Lolium multiflorum]|uniref:Transposase Tnp1/En/Spm-like domain-containing protein n=1 Tax=Lolium multiflorum TaxID=4521 RepID=A0AAD8QHP2_LOLMU|nr:hypothetical protein QYE76_059266 [Lolium multiflorum]
MLPPKSKAVTAISEQGQEMKSPITSKRRRNAKSGDYIEGSQGNVESQAKTAATPTETISKRQKKRKIEELVDDKLEELNDDVVITSVSVVQKPKCSYRNLLDNTLLVKVKEEKLEENIADKEDDWHSTKRCTDEHNDWFRARNPLKANKMKTGIEVGLTSPNSFQMVALGTVQEIENEEFVKVLVNVVFKTTTALPIPKGRMVQMGDTEAHCITWPRKNITDPAIDRTSAEIACTLEKKLKAAASTAKKRKGGSQKLAPHHSDSSRTPPAPANLRSKVEFLCGGDVLLAKKR